MVKKEEAMQTNGVGAAATFGAAPCHKYRIGASQSPRSRNARRSPDTAAQSIRNSRSHPRWWA